MQLRETNILKFGEFFAKISSFCAHWSGVASMNCFNFRNAQLLGDPLLKKHIFAFAGSLA